MRQAGENVPEVSVRINAAATAVLHHGVKDGAAFSGIGFANEEPVLLPNGCGPDRILDQVIIDLNATFGQEHLQGDPLAQRVINGCSQQALRQMFAAALKPQMNALEPLHDGSALGGANGLPQFRSGFDFSQPRFDGVEVLQLAYDPTGCSRRRFQSFVNFSPQVRPASGQCHGSFAFRGKGAIGRIAVALYGALEVRGNDVAQARCCPARGPVKEDVASRFIAGPKVQRYPCPVFPFPGSR